MTLKLGRHEFADDARLMMAIVNRTPDSFYDQGATWSEDKAFERVSLVVAQGAEIVDIGGIKAAPGVEISEAEERDRVVDFVARVREAFPSLVISVDTWRASVGAAVCAAGADVLNDAWGGADPELVDAAASYDAAVICTHTGGVTPRTRPYRIEYDDVVAAAIADTVAYAERAVAAGVSPDSVVIDPAHDFGKNTFHSLELTRRLGEMVATGYPVLVSLSNKDFVGETLDLPVGSAAGRDPRRDRRLRARRRPDLPRPRGRRDPSGGRHGLLDRRAPAARARDPGAAVRVVLVPGVLALLPEYAGLADPVAELRAACLSAVAWLGADVTVLADPQGARRRRALCRSGPRPTSSGRASRRTSWSATARPGVRRRRPGTSTSVRTASTTRCGLRWRRDTRTGPLRASGGACSRVSTGSSSAGDLLSGEATVDYDDDPFGVQYWVMRWQT